MLVAVQIAAQSLVAVEIALKFDIQRVESQFVVRTNRLQVASGERAKIAQICRFSTRNALRIIALLCKPLQLDPAVEHLLSQS